MQTLIASVEIIRPVTSEEDRVLGAASRAECLKAVYSQLFKENRDLDFFHNSAIDSAYLNEKLNTREFVKELLCSEMYRDYILLVNSNYRFVELCFERVLGRPATPAESRTWSSLLATEGLEGFAKSLTNSDEYMEVFGNDGVPTRRSLKLSSSKQGLPALPETASRLRYDGSGRVDQLYPGRVQIYFGESQSMWKWQGSMPPKQLQKVGAVLTVAGVIEVTRIALTIAYQALTSGAV